MYFTHLVYFNSAWVLELTPYQTTSHRYCFAAETNKYFRSSFHTFLRQLIAFVSNMFELNKKSRVKHLPLILQCNECILTVPAECCSNHECPRQLTVSLKQKTRTSVRLKIHEHLLLKKKSKYSNANQFRR